MVIYFFDKPLLEPPLIGLQMTGKFTLLEKGRVIELGVSIP